MIKKFMYSALAVASLSAGLVSCNPTAKDGSATQDSVAKEEVHNPATQTIPEEYKDLIGRWDLTVDKNGKEAPSWIEIKLSGFNTLVGAYVGDSGSQRPVSHVILKDGKFSFAIPPQWEGGEGDFTIEGQLDAGNLKGTVTTNKNEKFTFTGVKAPYLNRTGEVKWGSPIALFNGKDLTGWKASAAENQWKVVDGVLTSEKAGANLISDQKFEDFKLTAEFRYKEGGNSGIYLRGRYEVQIEDSPKDKHPGALYFGGVYGFIAPNEMVTLGPNEWQKYEITLRGRLVTIVANGKTIISNQEIPGITGGALDSKEGEPGPIYLQGDHAPIEFRNITITPIL
ncbi:3-keto-disaccharide hydrolase [Sphingobacterium spiritivorum]|uniref:3-keto-disaccharide hydrolase n=1 Tax=Sphingobacterium spiritivorum TaxID=258 RepID=UPI003DA2F2F5